MKLFCSKSLLVPYIFYAELQDCTTHWCALDRIIHHFSLDPQNLAHICIVGQFKIYCAFWDKVFVLWVRVSKAHKQNKKCTQNRLKMHKVGSQLARVYREWIFWPYKTKFFDVGTWTTLPSYQNVCLFRLAILQVSAGRSCPERAEVYTSTEVYYPSGTLNCQGVV